MILVSPSCHQADLEKNSQGFAADMVCLTEATLPRDVAWFQQTLESFFTVGATRIDLIGKVMDLDNEIGGHNFDIPLLEETEQAITVVEGTGIIILFKLQPILHCTNKFSNEDFSHANHSLPKIFSSTRICDFAKLSPCQQILNKPNLIT